MESVAAIRPMDMMAWLNFIITIIIIIFIFIIVIVNINRNYSSTAIHDGDVLQSRLSTVS